PDTTGGEEGKEAQKEEETHTEQFTVPNLSSTEGTEPLTCKECRPPARSLQQPSFVRPLERSGR
ncbi:MAG: hypothetical protein AAFN92_03365, partial [Bacteroidota bacterium]